eukprot:889472_1
MSLIEKLVVDNNGVDCGTGNQNNDICKIDCNNSGNDLRGAPIHCGDAGHCSIHCSIKRCMRESIVNATLSNSLYFNATALECLKDAFIYFPTNGNVTFIVDTLGLYGAHAIAKLAELHGESSRNIDILCKDPLHSEASKDDCTGMKIYAQGADFLSVTVSGAEFQSDAQIYCPFHSDLEPSCVVNGTNAHQMTDNVLIHIGNGSVPKDLLWFGGSGDYGTGLTSIKVISTDGTCAINETSKTFENTGACWKDITAAPTTEPTTEPSQPTTTTAAPSASPTATTSEPSQPTTTTAAPSASPTATTSEPSQPTTTTAAPSASPTATTSEPSQPTTTTAAPSASPTATTSEPTTSPPESTSNPTNEPIVQTTPNTADNSIVSSSSSTTIAMESTAESAPSTSPGAVFIYSTTDFEFFPHDPLDAQLTALETAHQWIFSVFISSFIVLLLCAWIDAKHIPSRKNDYLRITFIVGILLQTMDMMSDCFFAMHVAIWRQIDPKYAYALVLSVIFILVPCVFTMVQLFNHSKKHWLNSTDHVRQWLSRRSNLLYFTSIITGSSFTAVSLCNSYMFQLDVFDMGLTRNDILAFMYKRVYSVVLLENLPQLFLQSLFLASLGRLDDWITLSSITFSLLSIIVSMLSMITQRSISRGQSTVSISMSVTGTAVLSKMNNCMRMKSKLIKEISSFVGASQSITEVVKPSHIKHGVQATVKFNVSDSDKDYFQTLVEAQASGKLQKIFENAWDLSDVPVIDNLQQSVVQSKRERLDTERLDTEKKIDIGDTINEVNSGSDIQI